MKSWYCERFVARHSHLNPWESSSLARGSDSATAVPVVLLFSSPASGVSESSMRLRLLALRRAACAFSEFALGFDFGAAGMGVSVRR